MLVDGHDVSRLCDRVNCFNTAHMRVKDRSANSKKKCVARTRELVSAIV